jgi:hypothetical protein
VNKNEQKRLPHQSRFSTGGTKNARIRGVGFQNAKKDRLPHPSRFSTDGSYERTVPLRRLFCLSGSAFGGISQLNVTSDLAHKKEKADHRHGEWGARASLQKACNSFVVKILTSNPYALKILQTLFAKPAPVKAFQRDTGRGVPTSIPKIPKMASRKNA